MNAVLLISMLLVFMFLGIPIAFSITLSSIFFLMITHMRPLVVVAQNTMTGMDNAILLAIPLFTLSGFLMEKCGLSQRLVDFVEKLFGRFTGATGTITIVSCAIFAALTGSGPATIAAIGAIMAPALAKSGYSKETSSGILASGGALGPIIPPSVSMIVYGSTMGVPIPQMFIAGIVPGVLLAIGFIIVNYIISKKYNIRGSGQKYTMKEVAVSTWKALPVLLLPVIVLGGIYGGVFTPTEAAAISVVYALLLGVGYRTLTIPNFIQALKETVYTASTVIFIIGVSGVFGWILISARIPMIIAETLVPILSSQTVYLIILIILLLVVGCLMETLSAIVVLAPILCPVGLQLGMDPLYLGMVFVLVLMLGLITPPFGINLFTVVSTQNVPYSTVVKGALPFILTAIAILVALSFMPGVLLFLPRLLF